jgi:alginate O-acetyltransferase complex protein AlgI
MTLSHILVFTLVALLVGWVVPPRARIWILLTGSLVAVYWLQPSTPIRNLDFWLPTISIALTVFVWAVTSSDSTHNRRANLASAMLILGVILAIGLTRHLGPLCCLTPSRPPELGRIFLALALAAVLTYIPYRLLNNHHLLLIITLAAILALFLILKIEPLGQVVSAWLRAAGGQSIGLASAMDIPWLGFSYLAFRLLHVVRDRQSGKLPTYSLGEMVGYAIFFPSFIAGPIDRSQRFLPELHTPVNNKNLVAGGQRILFGVFKKFVVADSLALIALNGQNASQSTSTLWTWVLLYAYTLRIYLDFSGYTDIAIGLGRLMGFNLPENFDRPYLKQNLTAFWNSWHITLAQWFRAYYFNPLTRALRIRANKLPAWTIILFCQLTTLVLIGLWHGVTWNFAVWGAWHGVGLFIHNRWSNWIRPSTGKIEGHPSLARVMQVGGWFLTFNYVALGWVWFALPNLSLARNVLGRLIGI